MDKIIKKIYGNINYNTSELISDINLWLILTTFGTGFFSLGANLNNAASLMMLSILNMIYYIYSEVERLSLHTKDIIEIRNRLQLGDSMELLIPNKLESEKFVIEEMWDAETKEAISYINPGKEGQKVILKIPADVKEGWILRRKK